MNNLQEALKNFIDTKLNTNSYGVEFNVNLYHSNKKRFYTIDEDNGQKERFVPVMITEVPAEYIPIPNSNSINGNFGMEFEVFAGKTTTLGDTEIIEFENVDYYDTLNAIEEFKKNTIARYFPLGTIQLYLGGEDSTIDIDVGTNPLLIRNMYMEFTPKNIDEENIINIENETYFKVYKDATNVNFQYNSGTIVSIPYVVNFKQTILVHFSGTVATITNGTVDSVEAESGIAPTVQSETITIGETTGFEGIVERLLFDDKVLTPSDFDEIGRASCRERV